MELSIALFVLLAPAAGATAEEPVAPAPVRTTYLQSWFGAVDTDESWELPEDENGGPYRASVGTLPYLGGSARVLQGERVRYGYEGGGFIGWKSYDAAFRSGDDGLTVRLDGFLFAFEAFFGGVLAFEPRPGLLFYVAGGPALTWMQLDNDDEEAEVAAPSGFGSSGIYINVNAEEDDFSIVPYARAGVEYEFGSGYSWGLSVRYAPHEFDFGSSGELEFDQLQYFLIVGLRR